MKIILFLGFSNSGKTTTIERLCKIFIAKKLKVGVLKHTHSPTFTIDERGKDTWRFAKTGAKLIVSLADSEIAVIKKGRTRSIPLEEILNIFKQDDVDYLLVEGLHKRFKTDVKVIRILCAKNKKEAINLLRCQEKKPDCIAGRVAENTQGKKNEQAIQGIPVLSDPGEIASMIINSKRR